MSRLTQVQPDVATGEARELLTAVKTKMGMVPNLTKALANSPAALNAYLQFSGALTHGVLPAKIREQLSLSVGQANHCEYCVSAHSVIGKMVGLTPDQILGSRRGGDTDAKSNAILRFTRSILETKGKVSDPELLELRNLGVTEAEIAEVVANVALNIFTNYFNHVADTDIDFPKAAPLAD